MYGVCITEWEWSVTGPVLRLCLLFKRSVVVVLKLSKEFISIARDTGRDYSHLITRICRIEAQYSIYEYSLVFFDLCSNQRISTSHDRMIYP